MPSLSFHIHETQSYLPFLPHYLVVSCGVVCCVMLCCFVFRLCGVALCCTVLYCNVLQGCK